MYSSCASKAAQNTLPERFPLPAFCLSSDNVAINAALGSDPVVRYGLVPEVEKAGSQSATRSRLAAREEVAEEWSDIARSCQTCELASA